MERDVKIHNNIKMIEFNMTSLKTNIVNILNFYKLFAQKIYFYKVNFLIFSTDILREIKTL